jgi:hypothetical protein
MQSEAHDRLPPMSSHAWPAREALDARQAHAFSQRQLVNRTKCGGRPADRKVAELLTYVALTIGHIVCVNHPRVVRGRVYDSQHFATTLAFLHEARPAKFDWGRRAEPILRGRWLAGPVCARIARQENRPVSIQVTMP